MANSLKSLIKTGFGIGIGVYAAQILFLLVGMVLFFPAYVAFQQKQKEKSPDSEKVIPFVFMVIGVVIMGGTGFTILAENAGDFFD